MGSMSRKIKRHNTGVKSFERMTTEERTIAMARHGITKEDLQKSYDMGFNSGDRFGREVMGHTVYAAILLVLKEKGFSEDELYDTLMAIDHQTIICFDSKEIADEAFESTGLQLEWDEAVNRVRKVERDEEK